jgi:hypothetical protein
MKAKLGAPQLNLDRRQASARTLATQIANAHLATHQHVACGLPADRLTKPISLVFIANCGSLAT